MTNFRDGIYITMMTPYKNGEIDYDTVRKLVDFIWNNETVVSFE